MAVATTEGAGAAAAAAAAARAERRVAADMNNYVKYLRVPTSVRIGVAVLAVVGAAGGTYVMDKRVRESLENGALAALVGRERARGRERVSKWTNFGIDKDRLMEEAKERMEQKRLQSLAAAAVAKKP